jgi:predicted nicotinamide N-methyase
MRELEALKREDPFFARYGVITTPIKIRETALDIAQPENSNLWLADLAETSEPGTPRLPFWFTIWPASLLLADFISAIPPDPTKRWMEVGAGLGVSGLFAAAFGHQVTVTDKEPLSLSLARASAGLNGLSQGMTFRTLDWTDPQPLDAYDVILASEVVYDPDNLPALITFLERTLHPEGTLYLATGRQIKGLSFFEALKRDGQFVWETRERRMRGEDEVHGATLYTIRFLNSIKKGS